MLDNLILLNRFMEYHKGMKLISGPMATISHPGFRVLCEEFGGCDEYFTEMINAGSMLTKGPYEKYYLDPSPNAEKIVWQLTGKAGDVMVEAARELVELPGIGIDLNMGCSAPDIYKYGAGIGWMIKPMAETETMVKGVRKVLDFHNNQSGENKRLSVKLRLGDENFTDDGFLSFCDMLVNNGVEVLTLHPRTKKEKLSRPARYYYCQMIAERYALQGVKVYLNGNVTDKMSLERALAVAPLVEGVMISRACVQKPWIFAELKGGEKREADFLKMANDFIDAVEKYQPYEFWKTRLQRFFTYFSNNFQFAHYAQTQFLNAKDNQDLRNRLIEFFEKCPSEKKKFVYFYDSLL